jgi:hypothetical protein
MISEGLTVAVKSSLRCAYPAAAAMMHRDGTAEAEDSGAESTAYVYHLMADRAEEVRERALDAADKTLLAAAAAEGGAQDDDTSVPVAYHLRLEAGCHF